MGSLADWPTWWRTSLCDLRSIDMRHALSRLVDMIDDTEPDPDMTNGERTAIVALAFLLDNELRFRSIRRKSLILAKKNADAKPRRRRALLPSRDSNQEKP